ncbi:MAG: hypothetical protein HFI87_01800 [Bacilli bacterium]|nr:hypothetical protein [Bacilli bacterium]
MSPDQRRIINRKIKKYYKQLKTANSDYLISVASDILIFLIMAHQIKRGTTTHIEIFFLIGAVSFIFTMLNISRKSILEIRIIQLKEQLNLNRYKK